MIRSRCRFVLVSSMLVTNLCITAINARARPDASTGVPGLNRRGQEVPLLRSDVRLVSLDVIVTDGKGKPVSGLGSKDFTVVEDGVRQTVTGFQAHSRPTTRGVLSPLTTNTFSDTTSSAEESSAVVLVIDVLDTSSVTAQMYLRNQMLSYMKTVPPGTRFAIVQLDTELHLIQDFTSDPADLLQAVRGKRDFPHFSVLPNAHCSASIVIGQAPGQPNGMSAEQSAVAAASSGCMSPTAQMELGNVYGAVSGARRVEILRKALPQLTSYLSGFSGRKSIVWFYMDQQPTLEYSFNSKAMFDADQTSILTEMGKTTYELALSQVGVTMVDVNPYFSVSPEKAALRRYAQSMGGDAFYNTNGIKETIQSVADGAWTYYTLSYSPKNAVFDGSMRRLKVEVNDRELQLQYRHAYFAKNDDLERKLYAQKRLESTASSGTAQLGSGQLGAELSSALLLGTPVRKDVLFSVNIQPSATLTKADQNERWSAANVLDPKYRRGKIRQYELTYRVDLGSLSPTMGDNIDKKKLDFALVVYDDLGQIVNTVSSHSRDAVDLGSDMPFELTQEVAIPVKGNFFLRVAVHDQGSDKSGVIEIPVDEIKLTPVH